MLMQLILVLYMPNIFAISVNPCDNKDVVVRVDRKIMSQDMPAAKSVEKRSELRKTDEPMRSVELKLPSLPIYLFKVKDTSQNGFCLLVKEDSDILNHIHVGQVLNIRSNSEDKLEPAEILLSEIKHITKKGKGSYKGHLLVGLKILGKKIQPGS
jgi:hypothetical protein